MRGTRGCYLWRGHGDSFLKGSKDEDRFPKKKKKFNEFMRYKEITHDETVVEVLEEGIIIAQPPLDEIP